MNSTDGTTPAPGTSLAAVLAASLVVIAGFVLILVLTNFTPVSVDFFIAALVGLAVFPIAMLVTRRVDKWSKAAVLAQEKGL